MRAEGQEEEGGGGKEGNDPPPSAAAAGSTKRFLATLVAALTILVGGGTYISAYDRASGRHDSEVIGGIDHGYDPRDMHSARAVCNQAVQSGVVVVAGCIGNGYDFFVARRLSNETPAMEVSADASDKEQRTVRDLQLDCHGKVPLGRHDLPMCYSSPDADPSSGRWLSCKQGVKASPLQPLQPVQYHPVAQFGFLRTCDAVWTHVLHEHKPRPYWEWEPENCLLERVNSHKFCEAMEGRKGLLLVGDSLTRLMTTTLAYTLDAESVTADNRGDQWQACGGKLRIRFIRNDFLDARKENTFKSPKCEHPNGDPAGNTICGVFASDEILQKFDTLVVNSGAHPRGFAEYATSMRSTSEAVASSMKSLHGDKAFLVFRNTVPGHWGCTSRRFDPPIDRSKARELIAAAPEMYKWPAFKQHNDHVEGDFIEDGWRILDAFSPTVLRADSHIGGKDCLHYCVPGPADLWATLLYNMLVAERARGQDGREHDSSEGTADNLERIEDHA